MSNLCFSGLHMAVVTRACGDRDGLNKIVTKLVSEGANGIKLDPAPVLTDSAGSGYGRVSAPKEGDFVIVAFLDNDIQRPVILGSIPTPTRKPPIKVTKKNNIRMHKTADGTEITIDEDKGSPKISIKTKNGHKVALEDGSLLKVKSKDSKTSFSIDFQRSTIELKAEKISLTGAKKVSIASGNNSVTVSNSSGIKVNSPSGKFKVKVNAISAKATATAKIAAKITNIEGEGVMNVKSSKGITQVGGTLVKIG